MPAPRAAWAPPPHRFAPLQQPGKPARRPSAPRTTTAPPCQPPLAMAAALEEEGALEAVFDERFEYDAPRFYDFDEGSPAGAPADGWFDTEGPKGEARTLSSLVVL